MMLNFIISQIKQNIVKWQGEKYNIYVLKEKRLKNKF